MNANKMQVGDLATRDSLQIYKDLAFLYQAAKQDDKASIVLGENQKRWEKICDEINNPTENDRVYYIIAMNDYALSLYYEVQYIHTFSYILNSMIFTLHFFRKNMMNQYHFMKNVFGKQKN